MKKKQEPLGIKNLTDDVAEFSRDLWLAGLGAVATVEEESTKFYETLLDTSSKRMKDLQDEATKLFEDLVTRGAAFEEKGRAQLTAQVEAVREDFAVRQQEITEKVEETVTESVEKTLEALEVPTRTEVRGLTDQVERLTKQVRELAAGLKG